MGRFFFEDVFGVIGEKRFQVPRSYFSLSSSTMDQAITVDPLDLSYRK
jgi:hypothetical protein